MKNKIQLLTERKFNQEKILVQHLSIINIKRLTNITQFLIILELNRTTRMYASVLSGDTLIMHSWTIMQTRT